MGDAVAEIVRRRHHLDSVSHGPILLSKAMGGFDQRLEAITKRLEEAANHASGRENREFDALEALQKEVAGLASRLEDMRRGGGADERQANALEAGERRIESLREEIAAMSARRFRTRAARVVQAIELAIRELTSKVETSRMNGARDAVLAPIEQLTSELREVLAAVDPRAIVERLEAEIRSIARKLESFQASGGIDPDAFNRICEQTREVRDLLSAAVSRPLPIEQIERQINALTQRLDALPMAAPPGEGTDLTPTLGTYAPCSQTPKRRVTKPCKAGLKHCRTSSTMSPRARSTPPNSVSCRSGSTSCTRRSPRESPTVRRVVPTKRPRSSKT